MAGCQNLIGLGDYSVAGDGAGNGNAGNGNPGNDAGTGNSDSDAGTGNVAGMNVIGGSGGGVTVEGGAGGVPSDDGGSAGEGNPCPGGCDDGNDCTDDSCITGACTHDALTVGTSCGVARSCDEHAVCVRCRDTAPGTERDIGCLPAAPVCLGTGLDATCGGCTTAADCSDGNECTTDSCTAGKCSFATASPGSACSGGVCNGIATMEKCVACADTAAGALQDAGCTPAKPVCDATGGTPVCYECLSGADCATDNVSCTVETCTNHVCSHVATDSKCATSADVCKPYKCDAAQDCKQVDITASKVIIGTSTTQGNGGFEDTYVKSSKAGDISAVGWTDIGSFILIYNCTPSGAGCAGSNGTTKTGPGGLDYLAWLGGTSAASIGGVDRLISLPLGTVKLQVMADTNFQTKSTAATNQDFFEVRLLDSAKVKQGAALFAASNLNAQTGTARNWTVNGINATADVSAYATAHSGQDSYISFWASVDGSLPTDFFIDNVRLTATVCQ